MYTFKDLVEITAKLRAEDGCPWDREQTFESLRKYMREEAEEAVQAVDNEDMENLCEEIGGICEKMVRRHPWVFGGEKINSAEEGEALWARIKMQEKAKKP